MSITTQTETTSSETKTYDRFSSHRYVSPTSGRLPIIAHLPENTTASIDDAKCSYLTNLGFNSAIMNGSEAGLLQSIPMLVNHKLSPIPSHPSFDFSSANASIDSLSDSTSIVQKIGEAGKLGGIYTGKVSIFPQVEQLSSKLQEIEKGLKNVRRTLESKDYTDEDLLVIHLISEQSSRIEFCRPDDANSAKQFLSKMQVCTGPGVWFTDSSGTEKNSSGVVVTRCREFFNNLEIMNLMSNYTSRPFWGKVSGTTYAPMLFEAFNALAYGAQGLVFSEVAPKVPATEDGKIVVDALSPYQTVIQRIKQFEAVFLNARVIDVRHVLCPVLKWVEYVY